MHNIIPRLLVLAIRLALAGLLAIFAAYEALQWIETMVAAETAAMVATLTASRSAVEKDDGNRTASPVVVAGSKTANGVPPRSFHIPER